MADLVAAAQREIDARAEKLPLRVANGKVSERDAQIDFVAWHLVRDYLATGTFTFTDAGVDSQAVLVDWNHAEAAVQRGLQRLTAQAAAADDAAKKERLQTRADAVAGILRRVQLRKGSIDAINAAFRAPRQQAAA